jgi:hypothetical protein
MQYSRYTAKGLCKKTFIDMKAEIISFKKDGKRDDRIFSDGHQEQVGSTEPQILKQLD